ncbi:TRAP transporter small permease [Terasakiella sp. A23]|uniref:TRAP transporter small permease n=1 Tax=Terasakiella sp. FCG-A23 TaxID=3080561 RepID=UPI0029547446|nr:TRAP transporter small permease [Terasakiella sp. A23]MDV7340579.1 TRAP transporter small permease [Terasakiella sp. A23]
MDYRDRYPTVLGLVSKLIDACLVSGGTIVLFLIFINAVLRGAAGFDLAWSLEVTAFLLLWLTFLGCAAATARGAHMRVTEIVANLVPEKLQPVLELMISVVIAVLLCSLIYQGYNISAHTWAQKTTVLYWPVGLLYASLPVGMLLTLIFHLYNVMLDIKKSFLVVGGKIKKSDDPSWEDFE